MATKVTTLSGKDEGSVSRCIVFTHQLDEKSVFIREGKNSVMVAPEKYNHIVLIKRGAGANGELDIMLAYNFNPDDGKLYLGFFNNGIVNKLISDQD